MGSREAGSPIWRDARFPDSRDSAARCRIALFRPSGNVSRISLVQNRSCQAGNDVQYKRLPCGEAGDLSHAGGRAILSPAEIGELKALAPLGERVARNRRFHQPVSRRRQVRGSKAPGPADKLPRLRTFHPSRQTGFCGPDQRFPAWHQPPHPRPSPPRGRGES